MHIKPEAISVNGNPPSWYGLWQQYLFNLLKLEDETPEEPLSDFMFSFDGFRDNYMFLTDRKDSNLCLPPKLYKKDQQRPAHKQIKLN